MSVGDWIQKEARLSTPDATAPSPPVSPPSASPTDAVTDDITDTPIQGPPRRHRLRNCASDSDAAEDASASDADVVVTPPTTDRKGGEVESPSVASASPAPECPIASGLLSRRIQPAAVAEGEQSPGDPSAAANHSNSSHSSGGDGNDNHAEHEGDGADGEEGDDDDDDDDDFAQRQPDPRSAKLLNSLGDEFLQGDEEAVDALFACLDNSETMANRLVEAFAADESEVPLVQRKVAGGRCSLDSFSGAKNFRQHLIDTCGEHVALLKEYQLVGVRWLLALHEGERFGILADEMGLGKTAQTAVLLSHLYGTGAVSGASIVVCPATLVENWCCELARWAPRLRVLRYQGSQRERRECVDTFAAGLGTDEEMHVIVASHTTIGSPYDRQVLFKRYDFAYLVVDEAHNLKNSESQLHRHIQRHVSAQHRLLLTGSPIQNEISELQSLLLLIAPTLGKESLARAVSLYAQYRQKLLGDPTATKSLNPGVVAVADEAPPPSVGEHGKGRETAQQQAAEEAAAAEQGGKSVEAESPAEPATPTAMSGGVKEPGQRGTSVPSKPLDQEDVEACLRARRALAPEVEFLQLTLSPFILRRLKGEVISALPQKISIIDRCPLEEQQQKLYIQEFLSADSSGVLSQTLQEVRGMELSPEAPSSGSSNGKGKGKKRPTQATKSLVQNLMFRLRRICNHPLLWRSFYTEADVERVIDYFHANVEGYSTATRQKCAEEIQSWSDFEIHQIISDFPEDVGKKLPPLIPRDEFLRSAKIRRMLELVDELHASGRKGLVFSQFTRYLDVIEETLRCHRPDMKFFRLDGATAVLERQGLVDKFATDPNVTLFLLSTKAGGVGLNLTAADTVILMDQDWNPQNDRQAEDRAHRLGQTKAVHVHRLCCKGTLEDSILKAATKKLHLDEAFGGNADLLNAVILKDCLASSLMQSSKERQAARRSSEKAAATAAQSDDVIPRKCKDRASPSTHSSGSKTPQSPTKSTSEEKAAGRQSKAKEDSSTPTAKGKSRTVTPTPTQKDKGATKEKPVKQKTSPKPKAVQKGRAKAAARRGTSQPTTANKAPDVPADADGGDENTADSPPTSTLGKEDVKAKKSVRTKRGSPSTEGDARNNHVDEQRRTSDSKPQAVTPSDDDALLVKRRRITPTVN